VRPSSPEGAASTRTRASCVTGAPSPRRRHLRDRGHLRDRARARHTFDRPDAGARVVCGHAGALRGSPHPLPTSAPTHTIFSRGAAPDAVAVTADARAVTAMPRHRGGARRERGQGERSESGEGAREGMWRETGGKRSRHSLPGHGLSVCQQPPPPISCFEEQSNPMPPFDSRQDI
jgi:hypothetical protein